MNILITGAGFENKGAEAMLRTVQAELSKRLSRVSFYATVFKREKKQAFEAGFIPLDNEWLAPWLLNYLTRAIRISRHAPHSMCIMFNQMILSLLPKFSSANINELNIDALVDISGYCYHDGGVGRMINRVAGVRSSRKVIDKNYFMPQAWGGFTNTISKYWINQMHSQATLLYSRDEVSSNYLKNSFIDENTILESPDIAILFKGDPISVGKAILSANSFVDSDRPIIGVVPNMRVYERTQGSGTGNEYVKTLEGLVQLCVDELGVNVAILPNECILPGEDKPDDRFLCSLLASRFDMGERVIALTGNYSANEIKALIGNVDFLVASRFHSLVFALSQSVPVLALGWSHKYLELLKMFSLEKYVIPHDSLQSCDSRVLFHAAWQERHSNSEKIQSVLPTVKPMVSRLFDKLAESLRG